MSPPLPEGFEVDQIAADPCQQAGDLYADRSWG